jgi:hypothetical protein
MWILKYNRSRFNSFLFFLQKLSCKSMVMLYKSCRVNHMVTNKIEFAFFYFFLQFSTDFTKFSKKPHTIQGSNYIEVPGSFPFLTHVPLVCRKDPGESLDLAMWSSGAGRPNSSEPAVVVGRAQAEGSLGGLLGSICGLVGVEVWLAARTAELCGGRRRSSCSG